MRRILQVAVAAAILAVGAPTTSASADPGDHLVGGCYFNTDQNSPVTNDQNVGVIGGLAIALHADGTPSGATVSCWIDVNGTEAPGSRHTFTTPPGVDGPWPLSFSASDRDWVTLCEEVTFDDGSVGGIDCGAGPAE